jgi:hypothetical protein
MTRKDTKWFFILTLIFASLSVLIYLAQIMIFHKDEETFFLLFQDMAFLPIHTLLVVIILETLLKRLERQAMVRRLNMVVGVFFIEIGSDLIRLFPRFDKTVPEFCKTLLISNEWTDADFLNARKQILEMNVSIDARTGYIGDMQVFFHQQRAAMVRLMGNPNLMEHESFTDMLLAVLHLGEELVARTNLESTTEKDFQHLAGDMTRAYNALIIEWLSYMRHLKKEYPYLYSLAVRTNPFNPEAKATVC